MRGEGAGERIALPMANRRCDGGQNDVQTATPVTTDLVALTHGLVRGTWNVRLEWFTGVRVRSRTLTLEKALGKGPTAKNA